MTLIVMAVKLSFRGMPCRAIGALEGTGVILAVMAEKWLEMQGCTKMWGLRTYSYWLSEILSRIEAMCTECWPA
jgi:hypothetical protein